MPAVLVWLKDALDQLANHWLYQVWVVVVMAEMEISVVFQAVCWLERGFSQKLAGRN